MGHRVAVARNLLKAWLIFLVPAALAGRRSAGGSATTGWRCCSRGSVFLLGAVLYWYADRIAMGMVGARELLPGEAPALHATVESLSARAGVVRAEALRDPRRAIRVRCAAGRGARGGAALAVSSGCSASRRRRSSRGSSRTRSAHLRGARRPPADDRRGDRRGDRSSRRGSAATSSAAFLFVLGAARGVVRASGAVAAAASTTPTASPPSSASRRTGSRTRCSGSSSRWGSSQFQASPATEPLYTVEPVRGRGPRRAVRHAPAARRAGAAAARARSRVAREAPRGLASTTASRARVPRGLERKWAASYSPGRLLSEYHRR